MKETSLLAAFACAAIAPTVQAQFPPGEGPALGDDRIEQADIEGGSLTLDEIRQAGLGIFATNFNVHDGYGDGPLNPSDPTSPGGRPTLQGNGTFLRVNGLDSQSCMECHSVGSSTTVPFTFAVGGVGGSNNNAMFQPKEIDVDDSNAWGFAFFDGRYINPPFLFGSGGVELIGKEMTAELQALALLATANPDTDVELVTKGIHFGSVRFDSQSGVLDTSEVEGIDADLVVRPFGRKGEFASVRGFDVGALQFHFGMQPNEEVGEGVDGDGDGVFNEILVGELSALHVFNTNLEKPRNDPITPELIQGYQLFRAIGCAVCHQPALTSDSPQLDYSFPEEDTDPGANVYYSTNLVSGPAGFETTPWGGIFAPLFSDLKRHDMGPGLAESFGSELDAFFITARLWGVADTAPYLHDGRATTLTDAILLHGGEGQAARDLFEGLSAEQRVLILGFLRALRTPLDPAADLLD